MAVLLWFSIILVNTDTPGLTALIAFTANPSPTISIAASGRENTDARILASSLL